MLQNMSVLSGKLRAANVCNAAVMAEHWRDEQKQNCTAVSTALRRLPCMGGYRPNLSQDLSALQERLFSRPGAKLTTLQLATIPRNGDMTDPFIAAAIPDFDTVLVFDALRRDMRGLWPALDPLESVSHALNRSTVGERHYELVVEVKKILERTKALMDVVMILGVDELPEDDQVQVGRAQKIENFLSQPEYDQSKPYELVATLDGIQAIVERRNFPGASKRFKDFKKGYRRMSYKIYTIKCGCGCDMEYVGHTGQELEGRMKQHRRDAKTKTSRFYEHMREMGTGFFTIHLIEDLGEVSKEIAKARENHYILERDTYANGWNSKYEDGFGRNIPMKPCQHGAMSWRYCNICGMATCMNCGKKGLRNEINMHRLNHECHPLLKCSDCPALFQKKADKTMHERYCEFIKERLRKEDPDTYKINPDYEQHLQYELEKEQMLKSLRQYKKERNVYVSFLDYKKHLRLKQEWANEDNEKLGLCVFGW
eukprot:g5396.t1